MFLATSYIRYYEPDTRKAMPLYITALCCRHLFNVRHDGILFHRLTLVKHWLRLTTELWERTDIWQFLLYRSQQRKH